jgi:adenylate kinase family enzyme
MQRVVVIGATGSGKTTLALHLASLLNAPAVDLDTLYWQPNWQGAPPDVFRARVDEVTRGERWVISGNYSSARDLVWSRADTLVWLDYGLPLIFWRLLRRTIQRIRTQEDLWGTGNRETWRKQFFSRESLFLWVLQSRPRHRREYPQLFQQPEYRHLRVFRLHSPRETDQWIEQIGKQVGILMTDDC